MKMKAAARHRWQIFSRLVAAALGGYVIAALASVLLAMVLPLVSAATRADGVLLGSLSGFLWYALVVIWVFAMCSALRLWLGLLAAAGLLGVSLLLLSLF